MSGGATVVGHDLVAISWYMEPEIVLVLICGAANGACHLALHFGFAMLLVFGVSCGFLFDVLESNVEVEILKKQVERRRNVGHIIQLRDVIVTSPFLSEEIV